MSDLASHSHPCFNLNKLLSLFFFSTFSVIYTRSMRSACPVMQCLHEFPFQRKFMKTNKLMDKRLFHTILGLKTFDCQKIALLYHIDLRS